MFKSLVVLPFNPLAAESIFRIDPWIDKYRHCSIPQNRRDTGERLGMKHHMR